MKLTYLPYPEPVLSKNIWVLVIEFEHGDADAYSTKDYRFTSQSEFECAHGYFSKHVGKEIDTNSDDGYEIPWDCTSDYNSLARISRIKDMIHFDSKANKHRIVIE